MMLSYQPVVSSGASVIACAFMALFRSCRSSQSSLSVWLVFTLSRDSAFNKSELDGQTDGRTGAEAE